MPKRLIERVSEKLNPQDVLKYEELVGKLSLQQWIAKRIIWTFIAATFLTFALIFLRAFGKIELGETFMMWLGGATVAEVAGMVGIILTNLFRNKSEKNP